MGKFSSLFQAGEIGTLKLKNRLMMADMGVPLADMEGRPTEAMVEYYQARAKGAVGLITTQLASINEDAAMPLTANLFRDDYVPDWARLVHTMHALDTKVCIQLMHAGLLFMFMGFVPEGIRLKVPSLSPLLPDDLPYDIITEAEIECYIEDFAQAARQAKETGACAATQYSANRGGENHSRAGRRID